MIAKNVAKNTQVWQKGEEKAVLSPMKLSRSINMPAKSLSSIKMRAVKKEKSDSPMNINKKVHGAENAAADVRKEKILKMASPKVRKPEVNNKESRTRKGTFYQHLSNHKHNCTLCHELLNLRITAL